MRISTEKNINICKYHTQIQRMYTKDNPEKTERHIHQIHVQNTIFQISHNTFTFLIIPESRTHVKYSVSAIT